MSPEEIKHRFRLVAIGFVIFALGAAASTFINQRQTEQLDRHQKALFIQEHQIQVNQDNIARQQTAIQRQQQEIQHNTKSLALIIGTYGYRLCVSLNEDRTANGLLPKPVDCKKDREQALAIIRGTIP